jgi:hypothetical protein
MTSNAPLAQKMALELVTLTLERLKVPVNQESIAIVLDATELVDVMESRLTMFDSLNDCEAYIFNAKIRLESLDNPLAHCSIILLEFTSTEPHKMTTQKLGAVQKSGKTSNSNKKEEVNFETENQLHSKVQG